ncbi:FAD-dependent oxidoreductase [Candidatus Dependentiae bacterium]
MNIFSHAIRGSLTFVLLLCIPSCIGAKKELNLQDVLGKENLVDILILGSGPAGMNAAIHGARSRFNTLILEGDTPGGQLTRTLEIENFPGFKKISGPDLIEAMRDQTESFGAEFLPDSLKSIDFSSWPYKVTTEDGMIIHAMTVIVTTGSAPRKLNIPGEEEYFGKGVSHCAICDGTFYRDQDVVVIGGGDSAVEEAIQLINFGVGKVTVLVRGDRMRAVKCGQERLKKEDQIFIKHNTQIKEIIGDGNEITGVKVLDKITGEYYVIPAKGVFLAIGSDPNTWFLKDKVQMDKRGYLVMQKRTQLTSRKALYAAGDVESERSHQAIIAAGTGRQAGIESVKFLTDELGLDRKFMAKLKDTYYKGKNEKAAVHVMKPAELKKLKTSQEFETQVLKAGNTPVLVDFYTDMCPTCKQMLPAITQVAKDYEHKVKVFKVNATDEGIASIRDKYKVFSAPRILIFKNGKIVEDYVNEVLSRKKLSDLVEKHIGSK